jgi:hypothetical protein
MPKAPEPKSIETLQDPGKADVVVGRSSAGQIPQGAEHRMRNVVAAESGSEVSPGADQVTSVGEVLARASAALERGLVPSEDDLEVLAEDPAAIEALLERSVDLGPDQQFDLADKVVFYLAASDHLDLMFRWLVAAEQRLIGKSDLLVQLMNTWLLADGRGALGELRKLIRVGAIDLRQRRPVEVAVLLRDAARVVGDADSLREAYESMAQAPKRTRNFALLMGLVHELEDEEGPTQSEVRAIGLPILLQAFKVATDEELGDLASTAELYVRGYLRGDTPNLDAARSLEAILERAHERVPERQRPSIQNTLRELRMALDLPTTAKEPAVKSVAVTYAELLKSFDGRSTNLEIVEAAYESAKAWGKDGTEYLGVLRDALEATVSVADRFAAQEFSAEGAVGAFADVGQILIPGESATATQHARTKKSHIVRNRRGQPVELGPHLKFGQEFRLYLAFDKQRRIVYVGRIGDHLPGKKSRERPRSG